MSIFSKKIEKQIASYQHELIETEKVSFYKDTDGKDIVFDGGVFELLL